MHSSGELSPPHLGESCREPIPHRRSHEAQQNEVVAELALAKLSVAELADERDRAHHNLGQLAKTRK